MVLHDNMTLDVACHVVTTLVLLLLLPVLSLHKQVTMHHYHQVIGAHLSVSVSTSTNAT